jgi:hypothetical protein
MVTRAGRIDGGTDPLPVNNLSSPISIHIPLRSLESLANTYGDDDGDISNNFMNISCPGNQRIHAIQKCDGGAYINYTCDLSTMPYTSKLKCTGGIAHQCVYWDTSSLMWSSEGCRQVGVVATEGTSGMVICNCTHLTDFSSQLDDTLDVATQVVTSVATIGPSQLLKNIVVLIVLLAVWGIMAIACIYSRYLDGLVKSKVVPFGQIEDSDNEGGDNVGQAHFGYNNVDNDLIAPADIITRYLTKGDGTDHGQVPSTLTSAALTRRLNRQVLKWRVYKEHTDGELQTGKHRPRVGPLLRSDGRYHKKQLHSQLNRQRNKVVPNSREHFNETDGSSSHPSVLSVNSPVDDQRMASTSSSSHSGRDSWIRVRERRVITLTVNLLKTVLEKETSKMSMCGKLMLDWWEFLKTQHKVLSIFFTKDTVFNRPERIMVLGISILFTVALNCFLFTYRGSAHDGNNYSEIFVKHFIYYVIMSICQTPIMNTIIVLFKRTAPSRHMPEDRWVGALRANIPKKVLRCVEVRENVLRAERAMRKAKKTIAQDVLIWRHELEFKMRKAIAQKRSALSEQETLDILLLTNQCKAEAARTMETVKANLQAAKKEMLQVRAAQQEWMDKRIIDLMRDPAFVNPTEWDRTHSWVNYLPGCGQKMASQSVKVRAQRTVLRELKMMYLSREERAIAKSEQEQMAKFGDSWYGLLQQWAYRKYLNPLGDMNELLVADKIFMPPQLSYGVHLCVLTFGLFCSYYAYLFSILANRCAECSPKKESNGDDVENCKSCPPSLKKNEDRNIDDIALEWLLTLLYSLLFNIFVLEPLKVQLLKSGLRNVWEKHIYGHSHVSLNF